MPSPEVSSPTAVAHANPHALDLIMRSAESQDIVASEDIYDEHGVKLWSGGSTVTRALQQRLLERRLRRPLESCLRAQEGLSVIDLLSDTEAFFAGSDVLAHALRPHAGVLSREVAQLQLHPVVQLLLTAARATQSSAYRHAVRGMVLAGGLASAAGSTDTYFIRLALLGGLLHDIGEMYVDPRYLQATQALDSDQYRHVVAHPRIGQSLLATQTDYPQPLVTAVGEHHERLDGTGYPSQLGRPSVSALGQLLAVAETTLGISAAARAPLARASFAMRVIPGEYAGQWVGPVACAARDAQEDLGDDCSDDGLALVHCDRQLAECQQQAARIGATAESDVVRRICAKAHHLLERLRTGWNAMGMWSVGGADLTAGERFEQRMAASELAWRMRYVQRECLWPVKDLSAAEAATLEPLWHLLAARTTT